ncbi:hypothetical protein BC938DRAFT_482160, partial [Jimgerdemannia flammicorona]
LNFKNKVNLEFVEYIYIFYTLVILFDFGLGSGWSRVWVARNINTPRRGISAEQDSVALQRQGHVRQGEPLYKRALAIREKVLGLEHPDMVRWRFRENVLGTEHRDTATSLNNLQKTGQGQQGGAGVRTGAGDPASTKGWSRCTNGCWRSMKRCWDQSIHTRQKLWTIWLGSTTAWAKCDKAQPLHKRALAIRVKVSGSEHPDTAQSLNNLAVLYCRQGGYDKARPLNERVRIQTQHNL